MIQIPHTYSEWVEVLNALKGGMDDAEVLAAMKQGTVEWQSGVAERFAKRLLETVSARMNAANDRLQKNLNRAGGQEGAIVQALVGFRKEMTFLLQAIDLPALPEKDRGHYVSQVRDYADATQKALEDSARRDRTGKLGSIIRNHKVNTL